MSVDAGTSEIPLLLSGKTPPNAGDNLGSQEYSQVPRAVVAGGGFDDAMFEAMKKASDETAGAEKVPWLKLDKATLRPGQKTAGTERPSADQFEAFAIITAKRVKKCLDREDVIGDGVWEY
ncbi:hypothetical protein N0V90_001927 [Kalmusia sp. IMI 367209]|nr:hypothetical protein N0V90_001927 [Kalmusia sp. IMI 367209]